MSGENSELHDLIIIGGGPVGATLALAACRSPTPRRVLVLEARAAPETVTDPRALALSYGSRLILERLGVWQRLAAPTPITRIHVSQRGSFGRALLTADEAGLPALGYVVDYGALSSALDAALSEAPLLYRRGARVEEVRPGPERAEVEWREGETVHRAAARLVAVADGGRTAARLPGVARVEHDYGQWAVVASVASEHFHDHLAYERFTPQGPLALLPWRDRYALVWTASPARVQSMLEWDETTFLSRLADEFGGRQGRFFGLGPRAAFPLVLRRSRPRVQSRTVLIGNAAQTLHPVAGQGFNLGLRDAFELARALDACVPGDIGDAAMLAAYAAGRRLDTEGGIFFTDLLVRGYSNDWPVVSSLRAAALSLLDVLPPAKHFVMRRMIFGARAWP